MKIKDGAELKNSAPKNSDDTTVDTILDQMHELRPLPMGMSDFDQWAERIISGAIVPGATEESQRFALANLLLHLGPTEDHKEDIFFIKSLRKYAVNQVADAVRQELYKKRKAQNFAQLGLPQQPAAETDEERAASEGAAN